MKILIVSDSHGDLAALQRAVERERPDGVFHLGDVCGDARRLARLYPSLDVEGVAGNCDLWQGGGSEPEELELTREGARFLLCHGHRYRVKLGLGMVVNAGRRAGVDAVCFGHTHEAVCWREEDGLWVVNPGSVGGVHSRAGYAVALAEGGELTVCLRELYSEQS